MSLPDTIFIFVLALIVFGPKKLPEIGRQIGKLVGEFRRASNEFKFQIEEELRQADWNDKKVARQTIAPPRDETSSPNESLEIADALPAGQHPNLDNMEMSALRQPGHNAEQIAVENGSASPPSEHELTVTAAAGSEPRTSVPFADVDDDSRLPLFDSSSADGNGKPIQMSILDDPAEPHKSAVILSGEQEALAVTLASADSSHG